MKLTWFGHSAFRVETGKSVVMIDPFITNPTYDGSLEEASRGATHVVLTHGHDDHTGNTEEICKTTGAMLIANFEICNFYAAKGVENFSPGNHGGAVDYGDFSVAFVDAIHSSSTIIDGRPVYLGDPAGIVLTPKDDKTLLHMGDTDIFSDMALIDEIYRPAIGIVPIGDRFTMGGKLAAMACRRYYHFDTAIPCHYGTFPIIDQTPERFVAEMSGADTAVLVPERGKAVEL